MKKSSRIIFITLTLLFLLGLLIGCNRGNNDKVDDTDAIGNKNIQSTDNSFTEQDQSNVIDDSTNGVEGNTMTADSNGESLSTNDIRQEFDSSDIPKDSEQNPTGISIGGQGTQSNKIPCPWDEEEAKQPSEYTWDEFMALTNNEKEAFVESFENPGDYDIWLAKVHRTSADIDVPWKNGGKQPQEYTWDEFMALTNNEKEAFIESFENSGDYDMWLVKVGQ